MEVRKTSVFEKDALQLDGSLRERLKKAVAKTIARPEGGKPLEHLANVFSERVANYRLVYKYEGNTLLLVCFKNRDEVYRELEKLLRQV